MFKRISLIWFLILFIGLLVYGSVQNLDWIYVYVPFIGQVRTMTAMALIIAFAVGACFSSLFFMTEIMRRRWELRSKNKQIVDLEGRLRRFEGEPRYEPGFRDA